MFASAIVQRVCRNLFKLKQNFALYQKHKNSVQIPRSNSYLPNNYQTVFGISILGWLGFVDDDDNKESELITTLKRGVLAHKRQQYDKAEQLLHIALRIAQQQHNDKGITYCYDLMANVAFDHYKLDKAQKLFVNVLQRLLRNGVRQDDLKVIHISLKIARINHLKGETETANLGYNWCLDQINKRQDKTGDSRILYGVIQDWYAQFLLDLGEVTKSLEHLNEAYSVCSETKGKQSQECMLLLNDLGTTSWRAGDANRAENFLNEAIHIGNKLEDKTHLGVVHANLGLIFLDKGFKDLAQKYCNEALNLGKQHKNEECVNQANYCFEQIKSTLPK